MIMKPFAHDVWPMIIRGPIAQTVCVVGLATILVIHLPTAASRLDHRSFPWDTAPVISLLPEFTALQSLHRTAQPGLPYPSFRLL